MKVKITITGQSGHSSRYEVDAAHQSELVQAIGTALDGFQTQCRESIFNCTINIDHALTPAEAMLVG